MSNTSKFSLDTARDLMAREETVDCQIGERITDDKA